MEVSVPILMADAPLLTAGMNCGRWRTVQAENCWPALTAGSGPWSATTASTCLSRAAAWPSKQRSPPRRADRRVRCGRLHASNLVTVGARAPGTQGTESAGRPATKSLFFRGKRRHPCHRALGLECVGPTLRHRHRGQTLVVDRTEANRQHPETIWDFWTSGPFTWD